MEENNKISYINFFLENPRLSLIIAGFLPIIFALISQYGFGLYPCELCIYQRIPFIIVGSIGTLSLIQKNNIKILKIVLILSILAFIVNSGIALFHVGVEEKWWVYGECSASLDMSSIESLKKALFEAPSVRCDEVQFRFIGISMAGWNVIYSIIAAIFFAQTYKQHSNQ